MPLDATGRIVESVYSGRTGRLIRQRFFIPAPSPDLDGDGVVGPADLAALIADMNSASRSVNPAEPQPADLNRDGEVGSADLAILLNNFGLNAMPPTPAEAILGDGGSGCLQGCGGQLVPCGSCGGVPGSSGVPDGLGAFNDPALDNGAGGGNGDGGGRRTGGGGSGHGGGGCQTDSNNTHTKSVQIPDLTVFENTVELALSNTVPWIAGVNISLGGGITGTFTDTCCPNATNPNTRITYNGHINGTIGIVLQAFPFTSGDFKFGRVDGLAEFSGGYSIGPQLNAVATGIISASGSKVFGASDCPQCTVLNGSLTITLVGSVGGDAHAKITALLPQTPWTGTQCRVGVTIQAIATAGLSTSATVSAGYRVPGCTTAPSGLTNPELWLTGVMGELTIGFNAHGQSRTFPLHNVVLLPSAHLPL